jgi:hypothetical protein
MRRGGPGKYVLAAEEMVVVSVVKGICARWRIQK